MLTKKIFFLVNYIEFYILEKVCQLEGETGMNKIMKHKYDKYLFE